MNISSEQMLSELNEKQTLAVKSPRQPVLIIAGPGTGKTRTLIARIIYETLEYKIPADQILTLTFSNKAAEEIQNRISIDYPRVAQDIKTYTIHGFCLSVLKKNYTAAGLDRYFSVCDDNYQKKLLARLVENRTSESVESIVRSIQLAFSNHLLNGKILPSFSSSVFDQYQEYLEKHRLIDYNQILTLTEVLFKQNPDLLNQYQFQFQSILIDEFQDTDRVQYRIIKMLASKRRNIFVVADDDQSIYAWRGAHPENIRLFIKDFNIEKPIFLDKNYRSGPQITEAAQAILQGTDRIEPNKKIITDHEKKDNIQFLFFEEEEEEQQFIIKTIQNWHDKSKIQYAEMAVIYPRHIFGDRLLNTFFKNKIPYQLAAGRNLSDHPLMKKILLYLKLIRDPSDSLVLEDLLDAELGYHIRKQIQNYQASQKLTFRRALNEFVQRSEISIDVSRRLRLFIGNIANVVNLKSFYIFSELINQISQSVGELNQSVLKHNQDRIEDLKITVNKQILNSNQKIWLDCSDSKISWLATKMAKAVFKNEIHLLSQDTQMHVSKFDLVIRFDSESDLNVLCTIESLSELFSGKREGSLSVFFRWLQAFHAGSHTKPFQNYTVFDLETTDGNPGSCGIVEIAAVKIRNGEIDEEFQSLVNPGIPITPEAERVHHISNEDIKEAPFIEDVWEEFLQFSGSDLLIAHNGYAFDFPIMDRIAREKKLLKISPLRYDSLVLARNLFPEGRNSIDALASRFNFHTGTRHRALDDVKVLHNIFQALLKILHRMELKTVRDDLTEYVALGNFLENKLNAVEDRIYIMAGLPRLLSPYSSTVKDIAKSFQLPNLSAELNEYAHSYSSRTKSYNSDEEFFLRIMEMAKEFNHYNIDTAVSEFLSFIALLNPQDNLSTVDAVSLITYHSAKGLEFENIIILGLEDENMPSGFAYRQESEDDRPVSQKLEEQRRLLYVGITRAKSEAILTAVKNRFGKQQQSSPFLKEIKNKITGEALFMQGSTD